MTAGTPVRVLTVIACAAGPASDVGTLARIAAHPGESRSRRSDAVIVAPASYNTINKWAAGISDTSTLPLICRRGGRMIRPGRVNGLR